ncbi:uncharacterized protein PHALS_02386 [Plasmopara halstedii]|uniref:Uncharacterized protein n=1 Tax=Plasmopara halstedii TaxID=4781 RepID=A0A0P1AY68_PLAHL|nr:uncharacterized protein PHALS_02386 [Plasmopara halstedii]CEG46064.1 hypothetical protein PHALS_02386 [Plasmopara halstedii]|eukprot:XP_024582433.1 hypothetical protein PHALS_02386 [Plasmopara halstedii]
MPELEVSARRSGEEEEEESVEPVEFVEDDGVSSIALPILLDVVDLHESAIAFGMLDTKKQVRGNMPRTAIIANACEGACVGQYRT